MLTRLLLTKFLILFQFTFAILLLIRSKPAEFIDSPRYFLKDDTRHLLNELWYHSGSYIQTSLFSLRGDAQGALLANVMVWIICSTSTTYYIYKYVVEEKIARYSLVFVTALFTSNEIASWIIAVLSESIGLSFLFAVIFPLVLDFLKLVRRSRSQQIYIFSFFVLLAASKPLWAILLSPLLALSFLGTQRGKRLIPILAVTLIGSLYIAFKSTNSPYDETGLTHNGWYSITRAYAYSLDSRLGDAALGAVADCRPVLDLLRDAQSQGTPSSLYLTFRETSKTCPGIVQELNEGSLNSPAKILLADLSKSRGLIAASLAAMVEPVVYTSESVSGNLFGPMLNSIFHTGAFLILPGILIATFRHKRIFFTILGITSYSIAGAFVIYMQDGIEWQRHMLPMIMTFVVTSWISFIVISQKNSPN